MKKRIVFATLIVVMLVSLASIADGKTLSVPITTPVPAESSYPPPEQPDPYDGPWISYANCGEGYIEWDNMPGYYEGSYSFVEIKAVAADYSAVGYFPIPKEVWARLGDMKWWKGELDTDFLRGNQWWIYGIFSNELHQTMWETVNEFQIYCGGNSGSIHLPQLFRR